MAKKKILIFVDWYLPGYKAGGPIKSISSLVEYLKNDFDFLIVTSNSDFGETQPYSSVKSDVWVKINDSTSVFYASKAFLTRKNILTLIQSVQYDAVYLNSFFSFYFSLLPLHFLRKGIIKTPVLLAPRGMLGVGALKLKSGKKKLFLYISKLIGLHKNIYWHATSEQEKNEIRSVFGVKTKITTVSNLQFNLAPSQLEAAVKNKGELRLFFLSRVSEKKNLLFSLKLLSTIEKSSPVTFDIYGPIEDQVYWNKCLPLIEELRSKGLSINYCGAIQNNKVAETIKSYHFLLLPTLNENYGHVIVESFLNGKPVIISDQTPWRNLEKSNVGWDIPLNNSSKFDSVLKACVEMDNTRYNELVKSTMEYAKKNCDSESSILETKKMFNELMK